MHGNSLVVDGVVHAYNWIEPNWNSEWAPVFSEAGYGFHYMCSPNDEYMLTKEEFQVDWQVEQLEQVLFAESGVDIAVYHSVPLHDHYKDGLSALEKGVEFQKRNPHRVLVYGNANPLEGQLALDEVERQVSEYGISGMKLYPARYYKGRSLPVRLDDPQTSYPLIEKCLELGVNVIGVHKAQPLGPTPSACYGVGDIDLAAAAYPEMRFEVVHAGFAWLEETCLLLRFPNVYVNLELTSALVMKHPRKFAEALSAFMYWGGEDRTIFATGCTFCHPQPVIEGLMDFQTPEDMQQGYNYPEITPEAKRKVLGENFLRLHGIDEADLRERIKDDEWSKLKANGLRSPWQAIRG
jgi:predicted TIM-barrel fold metal-dependent hydrolase